MTYDYLIVGAGFSGSVCAERLAANGKTVLLIDKREHIGGNAYDYFDEHGVLVHLYGPHIFHTNSKRVFDYLSNFTKWRFYEHRVLAKVGDATYPIPINRTTINSLYGFDLDENGISEYLDSVKIPIKTISNSEDLVLSSVGQDLCNKFFRGYTKKQWGLDLSELSAGVAARIPTRTNDDDRYFADLFQFMPSDGYTKMFREMLNNSSIDIRLDCDFNSIHSNEKFLHTIYTGPIDAYFNYCFGALPYRSLRFEHQHLVDCDRYQKVGTVNFPNDYEYTRTTEFKHLTGQSCSGTSVIREYPQETGDPYYPISRPENEILYKRYEALAEQQSDVTFVGRLAQYRYYNMDQVVASALSLTENLLGSKN